MKELTPLFTLICISTISILWSGRRISIPGLLGTTSREKVKIPQHCRPSHPHQQDFERESMLYFRNNTRDFLDPVHGPLAFANKEQGVDTSCPVCGPQPPDIIMTFVDEQSLDALSVWLQYYKRLDHTHRILCIYALSQTTYQKLERLITSSQEQFLSDYRTIVVVQAIVPRNTALSAYRIRTLSEFLHTFPTLNLLFTDVDALWLGDPQPFFSTHPYVDLNYENNTTSIDIVTSQASFPDECPFVEQPQEVSQLDDFAKGGRNLVFSFIYFRNCAAVRRFTANLVREANQDSKFDDQRAFFCQLYRHYQLLSSAKLSDGSFLLDYSLQPGRTNGSQAPDTNFSHPLRLRLLSGSQVVHNCGKYFNILHQKASLAHCLSSQKEISKIKEFQSYNLLPIDMALYDWEMKDKSQNEWKILAEAAQDGYFNDSATAAFVLSVRRFTYRSTILRHKTAVNLFELSRKYGRHLEEDTHILNSVRVPKAGSSSLSIMARAIAGCLPDGFPACKFPGTPPGSCPREGLMCPRVKGHVDHRPNYDDHGRLPIITSLRDPNRRLLSAFFYTAPHRPEPVSDHRWETFVQYISTSTYRNVMTKMLSGSYSYAKFDERIHTVEKSKRRLCQVQWFYIIGMETAGALLLYETSPFDKLQPNPVVFDLPPIKSNQIGRRFLGGTEASSEYVVANDTTGKRHNDNSDYDTFRKKTLVENNGTSLIYKYNRQDFEVYEFARKLMCARLGRSGILNVVATLRDDYNGSFQLLKETIQREVELFCPNGTLAHPVELYCPNQHSIIPP